MRLIHAGFLRPLGALMAGAVLVLAFAPWQWAWLAPLALWSLLFLLRDQDPRRAFGIGYAFGLGQFGFGVSWVFVSIHEHGNAGFPLALLLTGLLIGFLALFPALVTAVTAWLGGRAPGRALW
ncbi:MAG: apolipoprotein N-acyltransferase, partial [Candidatus Macondimonas sp.]